RLAGYDAAIVTEIPGTTRDILRERIHIDGMPLHIADTAGLRDEADRVEAEGIRRAHAEMLRADRILYLIDATRRLGAEGVRAELDALPAEVPVTLVFNKLDLVNAEDADNEQRARGAADHVESSESVESPESAGVAT